MTSSPTVTLFREHSGSSRQPVALALSALAHCGVIGLISFGILYAPRINTHAQQSLIMRQIDLHREQLKSQADMDLAYPAPLPKPKIAPRAAPAKAQPSPPALKARVPIGPQTLIQPDVAAHLALKEQIPVPRMLVWAAPVKVVQKIVAPKPSPLPALIKASLDAPNHELQVSDVDIASSPIAQQKLQILPSTTSPVAAEGSIQLDTSPSTVSEIDAQPAPAAVMSLSNLQMEGTANLPPVNETAKAGDAQGLGQADGQAAKGTGNSAGGAAQHGTAPAQGGQMTATPITQPKTGQFGSVVLGDSLQYEYPEIAGVWNGRMAYTVYLPVGLTQSWILQYSLPMNAAIQRDRGDIRLQAPWPYSILRPNLDPNAIAADALMVHGFVNASGHFESLSVVFPESFAQADFVLRSLAHWQFRPALENGQIARVEVLLIIPRQLE